MDIQFKEGIQAEITCVPNAFIDELLAEANGDYVRVYLYLLRHCKENMKVHSVADSLNLTDRDITRAISYWEKKGIFKEGTTGVVEEEIRNEEAARLSEANLEMKREQNLMKASFFSAKNQDDILLSGEKKREIDEEEFEGILFVAKHLLPGGVTRSHVQKFEYMVEYLAMDSELIEFLLDYCASIQKTSPRYIERVALDWSEQGITTVKQAQELIKDFELTKGMKRQKAGQGKQGTDAEKKTNRFLNYTQGEVDYDSLAKQKALKILQQGGNKEWH